MNGYLCGPCAVGHHQLCNGFLKTSMSFCPCSDRAHRPVVSDQDLAIRARNEQLVTDYLRRWLREDAR